MSLLWGLSAVFGIVSAASTFTPARPPAIPLAVRSPYLSTWQAAGSDGGNGGYLAGQWPTFWAGQATGWAGLITVDGMTYTWMGAPIANARNPPSVNQTAFEYTSTRSSFIMDVAGLVSMNVTFLSPLTPLDYKRQSLLFSYLSVGVQASDGKSHSVQLYADISAEWVAGNHSESATWTYGTYNNISYHQTRRTTQVQFQETNQQADWGNWYWSTANVSSLSYQSGADSVVRSNFVNNGTLPNIQDTNYRAINDNFPVFGFANDLGSVGSTFVRMYYSLGLCQQEAINFNGSSGIVSLPSLWTSYFSSDLDATSFFYNDWSTQAGQFDQQVARDSIAAGDQDYLTITSLSARQAFGGVQLVGTTSKMYIFLKEISSDGNTQTVDVIFPTHPIFLYTNPVLLKLLLDPLFEQQETPGLWPKPYSIHDLGDYPAALGHSNGVDESQPLENSGDMILMSLAYAQRANDTAYLSQHYSILKQWNVYLVANSAIPANQISTDDFAGALANQTNLALKGILAIKSMSVIAEMIGNTADSQNFSTIAQNYINQWQQYSIASDVTPPHTTLNYGNKTSHGLLYNLYADKELGLNLVPQSIYDAQSNFYPTIALSYGVPLDTRHQYTKSDWEMFTASVASNTTQSIFFSKLANWINNTPTNGPFTDLYDATTGDYPAGLVFAARPVVGGHFALLGLNSASSNSLISGEGSMTSAGASMNSGVASTTSEATSMTSGVGSTTSEATSTTSGASSKTSGVGSMSSGARSMKSVDNKFGIQLMHFLQAFAYIYAASRWQFVS